MKKKKMTLGGVLVIATFCAVALVFNAKAEEETCPPESEGLGFICEGKGACRVEAPSGRVYVCDGIPDDMTTPVE